MISLMPKRVVGSLKLISWKSLISPLFSVLISISAAIAANAGNIFSHSHFIYRLSRVCLNLDLMQTFFANRLVAIEVFFKYFIESLNPNRFNLKIAYCGHVCGYSQLK
jgi:hypothetical protein